MSYKIIHSTLWFIDTSDWVCQKDAERCQISIFSRMTALDPSIVQKAHKERLNGCCDGLPCSEACRLVSQACCDAATEIFSDYATLPERGHNYSIYPEVLC